MDTALETREYESVSTRTKKTALWEALSPEDKLLPVFSFSQAQDFDRCQFLWHLKYRLGYEAEQSTALYKGTILHRFAQDYYECLKANSAMECQDWLSQRMAVMVEEMMGASEHGETMTNIADCTWLFSKYLTVQKMLDSDYDILDVERHFLQKFTTPQGREFMLQGYIDLLLQDKNTGKIWLMDHKSGQKFWSPMDAPLTRRCRPTWLCYELPASISSASCSTCSTPTLTRRRKP